MHAHRVFNGVPHCRGKKLRPIMSVMGTVADYSILITIIKPWTRGSLVHRGGTSEWCFPSTFCRLLTARPVRSSGAHIDPLLLPDDRTAVRTRATLPAAFWTEFRHHFLLEVVICVIWVTSPPFYHCNRSRCLWYILNASFVAHGRKSNSGVVWDITLRIFKDSSNSSGGFVNWQIQSARFSSGLLIGQFMINLNSDSLTLFVEIHSLPSIRISKNPLKKILRTLHSKFSISRIKGKKSRWSRREYDVSGIRTKLKKKKQKKIGEYLSIFQERLLTIAGERNSTISALASTFANGPSIWGCTMELSWGERGYRVAKREHDARTYALVPRELSNKTQTLFRSFISHGARGAVIVFN